ncbi:MAG: oligosaccharyl transferase, archaeosortase A system-associated [Methanosarcinales archaeon]|nr:oligosaccharyl transferase, archaeosortase A system-associated [Methanosarcinales archaeon]
MKKHDFFLKYRSFLFFIIISFIAVCIRLLSYSKVFVNGSISLIGFDSYYHMRRILYTISNFPDTITFDNYINYPYGSEIGWPPLFDQAASLLAMIISFLSQNKISVELSAAFFPLILGILTFIPVYFIASKIFNKNVALLSVFMLAILPAHISKSLFGALDHHVAEILLSTSAYAFFIAALKFPDIYDLSLKELRKGVKNPYIRPLIYAAFTGIFFTISLLTWIGSPIFIGLIVLYAMVQFNADIKENRSSEYLTIISITTLLVTLILIFPLIIIMGRPGFEISAMFLSSFQVVFLAGAIVIILIMSLISGIIKSKNIVWWNYPITILLLAVIGMFLTKIISSSIFNSMSTGISYLFREGIVLGTIQEAQPLFYNGEIFTLFPLWYNFALSFYVAIWAFIVFNRMMIKESYPPEMVFFSIWTLVIFSLTLLQRRFMYLLVINIALLTGFFILMSFKTLKINETKIISKKIRKKISSRENKKIVRREEWWKWTVLSIIAIVIILPNFFNGVSIATDPMIPSSDWNESLNWLKDNTPQTSFINAPLETPEYGILSWWDYGNWILYLADRPVVSNNFQVGIDDTARFFVEADESKAKSILDKRNVRYIIISDDLLNKFQTIALIAGEQTNNYATFVSNESDSGLRQYSFLDQKIINVMLWSLYMNDGLNLGSFRLVYESNESNIKNWEKQAVKSIKIFEYVEGAKLEGFASPNEVIFAQINIISNRNRTFTYSNQVISNETGWYEITLPYSTSGTPYETRPLESYKILINNSSISKNIEVLEEDVIEGRTVRVDLIN